MTDETPLQRRTVCGIIVTGSVGWLSGCTDGSSPEAERDQGGDNTITDVTVDGLSLVIDLASDSDAETLVVVGPDGSLVAEQPLQTGVTTATVDLEPAYEQGTYEVLATAEDETVDRVTVDLVATVEIDDVMAARTHPEELFEGAGNVVERAEAIVDVTNTGTMPSVIVGLRFDGDIPERDVEISHSGINAFDDGAKRYREQVIVPPGERVRLFSSSLPFSRVDQGYCGDVEEGTITIEIETVEGTITEDRQITYRDQGEECQIRIAEGTS